MENENWKDINAKNFPIKYTREYKNILKQTVLLYYKEKNVKVLDHPEKITLTYTANNYGACIIIFYNHQFIGSILLGGSKPSILYDAPGFEIAMKLDK